MCSIKRQPSSSSPLLTCTTDHLCGAAVIDASVVKPGQVALMQAAPHMGHGAACKACGKSQVRYTACLAVVYAEPTPALAKYKLLQCV
jgi:hypothetical protein